MTTLLRTHVDTTSPTRSTARIVGLDLARALAVFGMFYAHVGPVSEDDSGFGSWLMGLPHGRSSALFATLAGLALALLSGGATPRTGRAGRQALTRIVIRAACLLALGTALTAWGTSVDVILAYYGLYFLLALPFLRLSARGLFIAAGGFALLGPLLLHGLWYLGSDWVAAVDRVDPFAWWGNGVLWLLFFGTYPAVTWMAYVLAGMALGRLDLAATATRVRLAVAAVAAMLAGYGVSWLIGFLFPRLEAFAASSSSSMSSESSSEITDEALKYDFVPDSPSWLLVAESHSGTTFELVGNIGVATAVIVAAVTLLNRFRRARWWLAPAIAVGTMSLTAYVAHIAGVWFLLDINEYGFAISPWLLWGAFVVATMVLALTWKRFFSRGPLEYLLHTATRVAARVR